VLTECDSDGDGADTVRIGLLQGRPHDTIAGKVQARWGGGISWRIMVPYSTISTTVLYNRPLASSIKVRIMVFQNC